MSARNNERDLHYHVMDCRKLGFNPNNFDMVLDKSTIDTLLCGRKAFINVARTLKEVQRVLVPNGVCIVVSYGCPEDRILHFKRPHLHFKVEYHELESWNAES